jgi:hypothetical protein
MIEAANTSETSVNSHRTKRRYNLEDNRLHTLRREKPEISPVNKCAWRMVDFEETTSKIPCLKAVAEKTSWLHVTLKKDIFVAE